MPGEYSLIIFADSVSNWRTDILADREVVRSAASSTRLFVPKPSRHILCLDIGEVIIPLKELMGYEEGRSPSLQKEVDIVGSSRA
ncbi:hypothetical protein [Bradyrhizobium paxllaeri]|uniref:hypothetical protein n=1 Tax=Bradyrhizobium paxllaeri TaxID=190148 RepID=UPI0011470A55|nr:hypothetical protein [Bradyrhizobium paxllaeri]